MGREDTPGGRRVDTSRGEREGRVRGCIGEKRKGTESKGMEKEDRTKWKSYRVGTEQRYQRKPCSTRKAVVEDSCTTELHHKPLAQRGLPCPRWTKSVYPLKPRRMFWISSTCLMFWTLWQISARKGRSENRASALTQTVIRTRRHARFRTSPCPGHGIRPSRPRRPNRRRTSSHTFDATSARRAAADIAFILIFRLRLPIAK